MCDETRRQGITDVPHPVNFWDVEDIREQSRSKKNRIAPYSSITESEVRMEVDDIAPGKKRATGTGDHAADKAVFLMREPRVHGTIRS